MKLLGWARSSCSALSSCRAFVGAYIEFVHYVEGLAMTAEGTVSHHEEPAETVAPKGHAH